ncbi:MAG: metallophosphoesterase [Coprococcus sp.]
MQMKEISFIHLSDVNLGAIPDKNSVWRDTRYNEIKKTFTDIIAYANKHSIDFIFISGDLYDHVPNETELAELDKVFMTLKTTCVIYAAGDMDYLRQDAPLLSFDFKSKLYVIGRNRLPDNIDKTSEFYAVRDEQASYMLDCLRFDKLNMDVYGISYFSRKHNMPSLSGISVADKNRTNILIAHGGEKNYLPVDFQEIKSAGFTYAAMGHRHKYEQINSVVCYAGSPEPLASDETGRHGFVLGRISDGQLKKSFVPMARREYKTINYPVNDYMKDYDIIDDIKHLIDIEGKQHIYTINIVRLDGCEKSFAIADGLSDYLILDLKGENYERTDYDIYIKANRNNEFGALLDEMYAESPVRRDGAKLAVDTMIDLSGINKKRGNKMSSKSFENAFRQSMELLTVKRSAMACSEEVQEYENAKKKLDINPDVLDKLNDTWARERKAELEYRTIKVYADELPRKRKREKIRMFIRMVLVPLILIGLVFIITLPQGLIKAAYANRSGSYALSMLIVALCIMVCVCAIYFLSKRINAANDVGGKKVDEKDIEEQLALCRDRADKLREERRELQLLENQRKGLLEEISMRERQTEKIYYEMRVLDEAVDVLTSHGNICD